MGADQMARTIDAKKLLKLRDWIAQELQAANYGELLPHNDDMREGFLLAVRAVEGILNGN